MVAASVELFVDAVFADFQQRFVGAVRDVLSSHGAGRAGLMERRSFSIFYNDPILSLRPGALYLVGLNPGGPDGHDYREDGIESVDWWRQRRGADGGAYSSYLDDDWSGSGKGESPHQRNVAVLLRRLQPEVEARTAVAGVFAANLYFFRTPSATDLQAYPSSSIDCWSFHEQFLKRVRPSAIICNGNAEGFSAYAEIRKRLATPNAYESQVTLNRRRCVKWFSLTASWGAEPVTVVGVPHLSRPYAGIVDIANAVCGAIRSGRIS